MKEITALSDAELRDELMSHGVSTGPVTGTTRGVYEKKLMKLRSGGASKPVAAKSSASPVKRVASKSPARVSTAKPRRKVNKSESEDESDHDDLKIVSPVPQSSARNTKPVTSTPEKRTPSPAVKLNESRRSLNTLHRPANDIVPGRRTGLPPIPAKSVSSKPAPVSRVDKSPARGVDRPGATPPRKVVQPRTPPRSSIIARTSPFNVSSNSLSSSPLNLSSTGLRERGFLDLGNTTGEEDSDDGGGETSRIVYNTRTEGKERRSPLKKAWDRLLGYHFKPGKVPGTSYELRHGSSRTRVERDPKTGRVKVDQQNIGRDISTILLIVLSLFFVLLATIYVFTARPEAVMGTVRVISASAKDTLGFFYKYAILPVILVAAAALVVVIVYFAHKRYQENQLKEQEMFEDLVERIIDAIRGSSAEGEEFISVPHVRDVMFPPAKRRSAESARWERAVDFINANESRVATETRLLRGQECAVWRWISTKKAGWQGNAFAGGATGDSSASPSLKSANIPANALTRCLKIREVHEDRTDKDEDDEVDYSALERAVREKVYPVRPVHISFDKSSTEGVAFMKLADLKDAKEAFSALHGAWFNGHLVSVKYMRDRRYSERFPDTATF